MKMTKQLCVYCKSYTTCQYCIKYGRTIGKGIYQRNKYLDKHNQVTVKWLTDYYNQDNNQVTVKWLTNYYNQD